MSIKYDVVPNIRWARVTRNIGEMDLVLEGTEENLTKGVQSLRDQGVKVNFVKDTP